MDGNMSDRSVRVLVPTWISRADTSLRVAATASRIPAAFAAMSMKEKPEPPGVESMTSFESPIILARGSSESVVSAALTQK